MAGDAFHKNGFTAIVFALVKKIEDWKDKRAFERDRRRYGKMKKE
jgi:hypothetical protein